MMIGYICVKKWRSMLFVGTLLLTVVAAWAQWTYAAAPADPAGACAALRSLNLEDLAGAPTRILSARPVKVPTEGLKQPSQGMNQTINPQAVSEYCEVKGYVAPQNFFELRLPTPSDWNGKLFFSACPGFCGTLDGDSCNAGLAFGYASATSNGGHYSAPGFDGLWAANDLDAQVDFSYRSNHVVTVAAKKIIEAFYGTGPKRSYAAGCSKGGQAMLMAALRYPEDYDGIIPVAPVYDYTGTGVIKSSWVTQANDDGKGGILLDNAAIDLVHQAVLAACDETDGAKDGVVGDPLSCSWKPADLLCKESTSDAKCLNAAQVAALTKIYAAPIDKKGRKLFPTGQTLGAEIGEWKVWVNGFMGGKSINYRVAQQYLRYLTFEKYPGPLGYDPLKFDLDRDTAKLKRARALYDVTSADLRSFKARGGKVLMWHGWADSGIPARSSIDYYLRVQQLIGGREETEKFMRLFLLPGVTHCGGGDGADQLEALAILDAWVEQGKAPEMIVTTKTEKGKVTRTRPVFPYPKVAKYNGSGDVDDPGTWSPIVPASAITQPSGVYGSAGGVPLFPKIKQK
jgi:hypothetical protein